MRAMQHVARELRAEMARQMISNSEMARRLGVDNTWVGKRLRGLYLIGINDLDRMAAVLRRPPGYFLPPEWLEPVDAPVEFYDGAVLRKLTAVPAEPVAASLA
jgi:transcriptional regulator with XRE-family HTH domain